MELCIYHSVESTNFRASATVDSDNYSNLISWAVGVFSWLL